VLIAGFGRFGEQVAKVLHAGNIPYVAVDNNPAVVIKAHAQSLPVFYGDVSRPNVLRHLQAEQAQLAVVTLDQPLAMERTVHAIHTQCPHVPIFARAHSGEDSEKLHAMGVETTVPETLESSLQLAATILFRLGIKKGHVFELVNDFRDEDYKRLRDPESTDTTTGETT
jgi:CPA2 family monovalent cation:H+ antiporter-2